jgi:hypothetical protein
VTGCSGFTHAAFRFPRLGVPNNNLGERFVNKFIHHSVEEKFDAKIIENYRYELKSDVPGARQHVDICFVHILPSTQGRKFQGNNLAGEFFTKA